MLRTRFVTLAIMSVSLASCSSESTRAECVAGMAASCACTDGRAGAQTCKGDGTFGSCVCTGAADAAPPPDAPVVLDASPVDAAPPVDARPAYPLTIRVQSTNANNSVLVGFTGEAGWFTSCSASSSPCVRTWQEGTKLTLLADTTYIPNLGFEGWSDGCLYAFGNVLCNVTIEAATTVTANFGTGGGLRLVSQFGSLGYSTVSSLTQRGSQNIVVAGAFLADLVVQGVALQSDSDRDYYVETLPTTGGWGVGAVIRTSSPFGNDVFRATGTPSSNVALILGFEGTADIGNGPIAAQGMSLLVAELSPTLKTVVWSRKFDSFFTMWPDHIIADESEDLVASGYAYGASLGGPALNGDFLAKFSGTSGAPVWSRNLLQTSSGAYVPNMRGIAVDSARDVYVLAHVLPVSGSNATVNLGGADISSAVETLILAKFAAGSGAHLWSKKLAGAGPLVGGGLAIAPDGNLIVTGGFMGSIDLGDGSVSPTNGCALSSPSNVFLAKVAPTGSLVWKRVYGQCDEVADGVAVNDSAIALVGHTTRAGTFGGVTLGPSSLVIAKYASDGSHIWSYGDPSHGGGLPGLVSMDANGNVSVGGSFYQTASFAPWQGATLTSAGWDGFLLQLYP